MDATRARRDNITKLFESAREETRRAIELAVDYFASPPPDRTALQEAKVVAADREVREGLSALISKAHLVGCEAPLATTNDAYLAFIGELTGGNFQSKSGELDTDHIRRLVVTGATLRAKIAVLRDAELKALIDNEPVAKYSNREAVWAQNAMAGR